LPLDQIRAILDDPAFDQVQALKNHRRMLEKRTERLACLLKTIDKTILKLTEDTMEMTDAELYEGFTPEQIERYEREVNERYDPVLVEESKRRLRKLSKAQWQAVKQESDDVTARSPRWPTRRPAIRRFKSSSHGTTPGSRTSTRLRPRSIAGWASSTRSTRIQGALRPISPGLADFMQAAMAYYADHTLA